MKKNYVISRAALITMLFILSFCNDSNQRKLIGQRQSGLTNEQWVQDLEYFKTELPQRHKNLFFRLDERVFLNEIEKLKKKIPYINDFGLVVELMKITARIGDSHTNVAYWKLEGLHIVPLQFIWLSDGIFAVAAPQNMENLLSKKLIQIDKLSTELVTKKIEKIIPHENQAQVINETPWLMDVAEILYALGITDNMDTVVMGFEGIGPKFIQPVDQARDVKYVNIFDTGITKPLYLQNPEKNYWYTFLEEQKVLYCQYNSCSEVDTLPFDDFTADLLSFAGQHDVNKFIFDLRLNGGGNSSIAEPLIDELKNNPHINQEGKLYVCIGRRTFSSAILNAIKFKKETNAIFVGEATGGKPNHYGEVKAMILPNTGITITYSTKYFEELETDEPSFFPDIEVSLSSGDFFAGKDPVLETIIGK